MNEKRALGSGRRATNELGMTEAMEAFANAFVENGGIQESAAIKAGYSKRSARRMAYQLLENPRIRARIHTITRERFAIVGASALHVMEDLMLRAKSETVRLRAAADLMDRAGHKPLEALLSVDNSDALNEDDLVGKILMMLKELGHTEVGHGVGPTVVDVTPEIEE
jgi:hypothetical protein